MTTVSLLIWFIESEELHVIHVICVKHAARGSQPHHLHIAASYLD